MENPDIIVTNDEEDDKLAIVQIVSEQAKKIIDNDKAFQKSFKEAGMKNTYEFPIDKKHAIRILTWAITHKLTVDATVPMKTEVRVFSLDS